MPYVSRCTWLTQQPTAINDFDSALSTVESSLLQFAIRNSRFAYKCVLSCIRRRARNFLRLRCTRLHRNGVRNAATMFYGKMQRFRSEDVCIRSVFTIFDAHQSHKPSPNRPRITWPLIYRTDEDNRNDKSWRCSVFLSISFHLDACMWCRWPLYRSICFHSFMNIENTRLEHNWLRYDGLHYHYFQSIRGSSQYVYLNQSNAVFGSTDWRTCNDAARLTRDLARVFRNSKNCLLIFRVDGEWRLRRAATASENLLKVLIECFYARNWLSSLMSQFNRMLISIEIRWSGYSSIEIKTFLFSFSIFLCAPNTVLSSYGCIALCDSTCADAHYFMTSRAPSDEQIPSIRPYLSHSHDRRQTQQHTLSADNTDIQPRVA